MTQLADERTRHKAPVLGKPTTAGPAWLDDLRKAGERRFAESGYPTDSKLESYRWTNLRPVVETEWAPAINNDAEAAKVVAEYSFGGDAYEVVLSNGHYTPSLS